MLPSEFLSLMQPLNQRPRRGDVVPDGKHYFRRVTLTADMVQPLIRHYAYRLEKGGRLMADPEVNPVRYIVPFHDFTVYDNLCTILNGEGDTSIRTPQSSFLNKSFLKTNYRTTLRATHQAVWEFGRKSL